MCVYIVFVVIQCCVHECVCVCVNLSLHRTRRVNMQDHDKLYSWDEVCNNSQRKGLFSICMIVCVCVCVCVCRNNTMP